MVILRVQELIEESLRVLDQTTHADNKKIMLEIIYRNVGRRTKQIFWGASGFGGKYCLMADCLTATYVLLVGLGKEADKSQTIACRISICRQLLFCASKYI